MIKLAIALNVNFKNKKNKVINKETLQTLNEVDSCKVSKASVEIMLERFCNGKEVGFPFSQ